LIASEYQGGLSRYAHVDDSPTPETETKPNSQLSTQQLVHRRADSNATVLASIKEGSMAVNTSPGMGMYSYPASRTIQVEGQVFENVQIHSRKSSAASFLAVSSSHSAAYGMNMPEQQLSSSSQNTRGGHSYRDSDVSSVASMMPQAGTSIAGFQNTQAGNFGLEGMVTPPPSEKAAVGEKEFLSTPEEIRYMQVFVEEVGVWMDSLDKEKHFSRLIPYHSLKSPMLLNAFLACGVKHLTLIDSGVKDDKALFYYDTATTQLLRNLQNPDRNTAECATTAVVLNVYEIMSEKPAQRMSHIAGARALIRECGWNAKSTGIGAACFWLNIGMEVLSCLAFNWQTAWDPDQWGVDMEFSTDRPASDEPSGGIGDEEIWVHRIFYIVAKIANFRATIPRFQEASPHDEQVRLGNRLAQWQELKKLCVDWNYCCPRTMHPFGYLSRAQTQTKSAFPNIWYVQKKKNQSVLLTENKPGCHVQ
jgi:hypothetical protein